MHCPIQSTEGTTHRHDPRGGRCILAAGAAYAPPQARVSAARIPRRNYKTHRQRPSRARRARTRATLGENAPLHTHAWRVAGDWVAVRLGPPPHLAVPSTEWQGASAAGVQNDGTRPIMTPTRTRGCAALGRPPRTAGGHPRLSVGGGGGTACALSRFARGPTGRTVRPHTLCAHGAGRYANTNGRAALPLGFGRASTRMPELGGTFVGRLFPHCLFLFCSLGGGPPFFPVDARHQCPRRRLSDGVAAVYGQRALPPLKDDDASPRCHGAVAPPQAHPRLGRRQRPPRPRQRRGGGRRRVSGAAAGRGRHRLGARHPDSHWTMGGAVSCRA